VDVDVVIVAHQSADHIEEAVGDLPAIAHVVVVDNASTDLSSWFAERAGATVTVNDVNAGFAAAANQGARLGAADAILFLNPDASIAPAEVKALARLLDRDPQVAVVSPRVHHLDGSDQRVLWPFPSSAGAWREALALHRLRGESPRKGFVTGTCFMVRRSAFEDLGGFDARYWLYGEETDLCRRAIDAGWRVEVMPGAAATHAGAASRRTAPDLVDEHFARGTERYIADREGALGLVSYRIANVVGAAIRVLVPGSDERRAGARRRLARYVHTLTIHPARVPLESPATVDEHAIVVCSLEPWDDVWRRNQFFVRELLESDPLLRVLFVEPPFDRLHRLRRGEGAPRRRGLRSVRPDGRLLVLQPAKHVPRLVGDLADRSLGRQVTRAAAACGFGRPILWINDTAYADLVGRGWPTLYDITDDWSYATAPARAHRRFRRNEQRLLERADAVVACSPNLVDTRRSLRDDVVLIPNAVDVRRFTNPHSRPLDLPGGPTAVYVGTLHEDRLDIDLLTDLATGLRETQVVLVGPVALSKATRERLSTLSNLHLLGARPYAEVPGYLQHADVIVVPHVVTPFTESLDPIKAYECRAVGRPTVATRVPGFTGGQGTIRAVRRSEFVPEVAAVLRTPAPTRPDASTPTWAARARRFAAVVDHARTAVGDRRAPRRVVFVDHCAQLSGAELALERLLAAIDDVATHVILGEDGPIADRLRAVGASVEVIPLAHAVGRARRAEIGGLSIMSRLVPTWREVHALRMRFRELAPDLVHTNSLKAAVYGGIAARLERIPVVWHIRDRVADDYLPPWTASAFRLLASLVPEFILFNSEATRQACKTRIAIRAVPSRVVHDPAPTVPPRRPRATTSPGLRFAMVGRLTPWKGQHVFLRAFAQAFCDSPETAVIAGSAMFGEDAYQRELEQLAKDLGVSDRVEFAGFVDDVPALLAESDALVHASVIAEPFGQVVLEGMASGLPVIATAAGGPVEVITDEVDGLLVTPDDVPALAAQLRRLRDDADLRHRLATAAKNRAQDFTARAVSEQVRAAWQIALHRHRRR
jgi:glycosyltransferase involved in cell wall biosynthesis